VPLGIRAVAAIVVIALVYAFIAFPKSLKVEIAYTRGQKAEAAGQFADAERYFKTVADGYPNDNDALQRLVVTSFKAGDYLTCAATFDKLNGRELDEKDIAELKDIQDQLEQKLK
jgi:hypothetical protein